MFFDGDEFAFGFPLIDDVSEYLFKKDKKDTELCSANEGFLRGNMFENEYEKYKNLTYLPLNISGDREKLLFRIMKYDFAVNDLNLYLDLHPEDSKIYEKFREYTKKCIDLKEEYSKNYGPLTLDQVDSDKYKWEENPWPWDNDGGSMYV